MNRTLSYVNGAGVLALAILCVWQWRANRNAAIEVHRLTRVEQQQAAKLDEQQKSAEACAADLNQFRDQVARAHSNIVEVETRLRTAEHELAQAINERDQLKGSMSHWTQAVASRDARLKEVGEQLQELATERNKVVQQFNEVAGKYNGVVNELSARTKEYNDLVEKYNATVPRAQSTASK